MLFTSQALATRIECTQINIQEDYIERCYVVPGEDDYTSPGSSPTAVLEDLEIKYAEKLAELQRMIDERTQEIQARVEEHIKAIEQQIQDRIRAEEIARNIQHQVQERIQTRINEANASIQSTIKERIEAIKAQAYLSAYLSGISDLRDEILAARKEIDQLVYDLKINNHEEYIAGQHKEYQEFLQVQENKLYQLAEASSKELSEAADKVFRKSVENSSVMVKKDLTQLMKVNSDSFVVDPLPQTIEVLDHANKVYESKLSEEEKFLARKLGLIQSSSTTPYSFASSDPDIKEKLSKLWDDANKAIPYSPQQKISKSIGLSLLKDADFLNVKGLNEEAKSLIGLSRSFIDFASGIIPLTAFPRDLYEFFTGENFFTGEKLSTFERSLSLLGIVSIGSFSSMQKGLTTLTKAIESSKYLKQIIPPSLAVRVLTQAKRIVEVGEKIGIAVKSEFKKFGKLLGGESGSFNFFEKVVKDTEKGAIKLADITIPAPAKLEDLKKVLPNPLESTKYTKKVRDQMEVLSDPFHAFPKSVDGFAGMGRKVEFIGGDGIKRIRIELDAIYRDKSGHFEWIIEANGAVNHRLFRIKE